MPVIFRKRLSAYRVRKGGCLSLHPAAFSDLNSSLSCTVYATWHVADFLFAGKWLLTTKEHEHSLLTINFDPHDLFGV